MTTATFAAPTGPALNYDGSVRGHIDPTAYVGRNVYIAPTAWVSGNARVSGNAWVSSVAGHPGNAQLNK